MASCHEYISHIPYVQCRRLRHYRFTGQSGHHVGSPRTAQAVCFYPARYRAVLSKCGVSRLLAYPVFAIELLGGIALVLGIYARQASLLLVPIMAAATSVHIGNGWVFTSKGGGWEYPVFLISASIALWLAGDGALSLKRSKRFVPGF